MYLQTMLELSHMTDHIKFEWMMCDLLSSHKYKGIDPQSPGMRDNGKDALYHDTENAIVFAFSIEKGWKGKFERDFESAKQHDLMFKTFIFCSNQLIPATERDKKIAEKATQGIAVEFYDAGRIKVLLDTHYKKIRQIYLGIQDNTTIRRKIRNTLFDPFNEVAKPQRWLLLNIVGWLDMIGLFALIKDEDLTLICETQEEFDAFNRFADNFIRLRKLATIIDNYYENAILHNFPTNNVTLVHAISEYTKWLFTNEGEALATLKITTGYFPGDLEHCKRESKVLLQDQELIKLMHKLGAIQQECSNDRANILALEGFHIDE